MKHGRKILGAAGLGLGLAALALALPHCLLLPESGLVGESRTNQMPSVKITGGVLLDSVGVAARVHFYWFGADNDGVVRWFEYAVDDTVTEGAWHRTTAFDASVTFTARTPSAEDQFADWHIFYLRAVDDDNTRSAADKRFFNARTIAPVSQIVRPTPVGDARWASTIRMTWQGEDPDGSRSDGLPAFFEYKQVLFLGSVNVGDTEGLIHAFQESSNVFLDTLRLSDYPSAEYFRQAKRAWVRVPGTVNSVWLENMAVGKKYGFAVRAIDESGAIEPNLEWGKFVVFEVLNKNIDVYLSEQGLGVRMFNSSAYSDWDVSVAPGQRLRFRWEGDATASGSEPGPSNYGFDIPDPESEDDRAVDGMGGWIGWGDRTQMQNAVSFGREHEGETHHFYLKMRDISRMEATETRCHVALTVARLSFIRKFLLLDDLYEVPNGCRSLSAPSDAQEDAYLRRMTASMADFLPPGERPGEFNALGGPGDPKKVAVLPDAFLDTLGVYQNVIWDCGNIDPQNTALYIDLSGNGARGHVARYRGAGGNLLFMIYRGPATNITGNWPLNSVEPRCPFEGLSTSEPWTRFSFLWQALHMRGCAERPHDPEWSLNTLVAARAENSLYPDLVLDRAAFNCSSGSPRGVREYEVLWPGTSDPDEIPWFERENGMEILYRGQTYRSGKRLDKLPVAWRTFATHEDSLQGISPGRVVCFAFHPYWFYEDGVRQAMTLALQWLVTGSEF